MSDFPIEVPKQCNVNHRYLHTEVAAEINLVFETTPNS